MLSWFEEIATSLQLFLIALLAWKLCALKNRLLGISWKWVRAWLTGLVLRDLLDPPHDEVALSLALGYIWVIFVKKAGILRGNCGLFPEEEHILCLQISLLSSYISQVFKKHFSVLSGNVKGSQIHSGGGKSETLGEATCLMALAWADPKTIRSEWHLLPYPSFPFLPPVLALHCQATWLLQLLDQ